MLKFPDNTQASVVGLDEILAQLYTEDRKATAETAEEIVNRLEEKKNFIPPSEHVRREYVYVLLKEYRKYIKDRSHSRP
jgi:predicted nucleic-acid-binding protein